MKKPQQDSGPAGWPYHLQMKPTQGASWSGILFQGQVAIARVTGSPDGGDVQDLRFSEPEREAAFLTWVRGVRLPPGVERRAEAVVHFMMGREAAELTEGVEEAVELLGALIDFATVEDEDDSELRSSCEPLPLHTACSWAMRALGISAGEEVELFDTYNDAGFQLAELGLMMMANNPRRFVPESSRRVVDHLVSLLAALGTTYEHTATGRMRKGEQESLSDTVDFVYGEEADVLSLTMDHSCQHEVLLSAMCLNASRMCAYLPADTGEQEELLDLAVALIRALTVACRMDVNAVLTHRLGGSEGRAGTKRGAAPRP